MSAQFDSQLGKATLMSAPMIVKQKAFDELCVSFSYVITSPAVVLYVAVSLLSTRSNVPPSVVKKLTFRTMQSDGGVCQLTINNNNGTERVLLVADKISFTSRVVDVFVRNVNISEGRCLLHCRLDDGRRRTPDDD
jgi:hypothetical protein